MRPDSISEVFARDCATAGIEGLTFHNLRHETIGRFFECTVWPSAWMGCNGATWGKQ